VHDCASERTGEHEPDRREEEGGGGHEEEEVHGVSGACQCEQTVATQVTAHWSSEKRVPVLPLPTPPPSPFSLLNV
jgi:hypothetical protein